MNKINSKFKIDDFNLKLIRKGDLINYEGPILTHYVDPSNYKHYFYLHLDNDEKYNRWLIFSIDNIDHFKRFLNGYISGNSLINFSESVYIMDMDIDFNKIFFKIDKSDLKLNFSNLQYIDENYYNKEYINHLKNVIFNPLLEALTDKQIIEICKLISPVESDISIARDSNMITCKFKDDIEDIVFVTIRTDYAHESSNKKIIDRVSFTRNVDNNLMDDLLNDEIINTENFEKTHYPLSHIELLDVFKYLQSINIKI
jgi:hypothetical protein